MVATLQMKALTVPRTALKSNARSCARSVRVIKVINFGCSVPYGYRSLFCEEGSAVSESPLHSEEVDAFGSTFWHRCASSLDHALRTAKELKT